MPKPFETKRENGQTDVQVVVGLVGNAEPGTLYSYDTLREALQEGAASEFDNRRVGDVARRASRFLLRTKQRTLQVVPTVGYRMAAAIDHMPMAVTRQSKADRQLKDSLNLLTNVRWDELDPINREVHKAHLTVTSALVNVTRQIMRQNARRDDSIKSMLARLDDLESKVN